MEEFEKLMSEAAQEELLPQAAPQNVSSHEVATIAESSESESEPESAALSG
jgi:hypothetical protein